MARARIPRAKGESTTPEILRSIRLGDNGDVYGPGEEDEFLEALETHIDTHNEQVKTAKQGKPLDVNTELERLTAGGHIINFKGVEVDDDELQHSDQDLQANQAARRRALVEGAAPGDESTPPPASRRSTRKGPEPTTGVESNEETKRLNDGAGEELTEEQHEALQAEEAARLKANQPAKAKRGKKS